MDNLQETLQTFCPCLCSVNPRTCGLLLVTSSVFLNFILQSVGMFTISWATNETCSAIGLYKTCCDNECYNEGFGIKILGLEASSYAFLSAILLILMYSSVKAVCSDTPTKSNTACFLCFIPTMLFIPGILSFIGCMIAVGKPYVLGQSFYLNLTSSIILNVTGILGCGCFKCCNDCDEYDSIN